MLEDMLKEIAIGQGYVPKDCTLPGALVMHLTNQGDDPCKDCNMDRSVCKGRPKS